MRDTDPSVPPQPAHEEPVKANPTHHDQDPDKKLPTQNPNAPTMPTPSSPSTEQMTEEPLDPPNPPQK